MSAHSAGPWIAFDTGASVEIRMASDRRSQRGHVADVHWDRKKGRRRYWANARLIEAAPETFDALKEIVAFIGDVRPAYPAVARALALIARVKGRTP